TSLLLSLVALSLYFAAHTLGWSTRPASTIRSKFECDQLQPHRRGKGKGCDPICMDQGHVMNRVRTGASKMQGPDLNLRS
ncbi:hypothetical protein HAX54_046632, partial [Datura stramonium]|nr:hypothetical protein [Datura stramonium]